MSKRKIIKIDADKCTGCGLCMPNCPEGAIQLIDGKARLISDLFCDGLGACIGHCPEDAITIEEREAEPYNEKKVMENIIKQGPNVIKAHLEHLRAHGEESYLSQAMDELKRKNIRIAPEERTERKAHSSCPGSRMMDLSESGTDLPGSDEGTRSSQLRQWPVQLHLVSPEAPYYRGKDVVIAADCVAYALADFHKDHLKGKSLAIACPKLDSDQDVYAEKIKALIDEAKVNTITVMTMEVPCCMGLLMLVKEASRKASRKVPIKHVIVGIKGNIVKEEWI
jgi:ferredoxin